MFVELQFVQVPFGFNDMDRRSTKFIQIEPNQTSMIPQYISMVVCWLELDSERDGTRAVSLTKLSQNISKK